MSNEEDRVSAWLDKARPDSPFPCPVCSATGWDQTPLVAIPTVRVEGQGKVSAGPDESLILVPISCRNCGLTMFLDAETARVVREGP